MQLNSRQSIGFAAGLVVLTLLAYMPAMHAGFIWDDDDYVINNDTLRDLSGLSRIWSDPSATPQYYPFVHTTFWMEYQTWRLWAPGYHVVNVIIHLLNSLLVWQLCRRLHIPAAWLVGLLFAIHPVHVESVAWITERKNVLSGLFYLGSAFAYLENRGVTRTVGETDVTRSSRWTLYVLSLVLFVSALLSKTVTATLPAALLLVLWWKQGTISKRQWISLAPMFVVGIVFGMLTVWLEKHHVGAQGMDWELSPIQRILIAGRVICFYAGKLLLPTNLMFTYPRWNVNADAAWQYLFPAAVVITIGVLFLLRNRIGRGPVVAVCFFCGTLFPALGFFDVYPMRFSFVADHFQYLASLGLLVMFVQIGVVASNRVFANHERSSGLTVVAVTASLTIALATLTFKQTMIYHNLETLWRDTLARNPTSWMAHNNLGALLNRRGDFVEAEKHLLESIRLKADFADSVNNLGKAREGQGDIAGATRLYERAVEINPGDPKTLNNLGAIYGAAGRLDDARELIERALQGNPKLAGAYGNLGSIEAAQGNLVDAIKNYRRSLELDEQAIETRINLVRLLMQTGSFSNADRELQVVLRQNPKHQSALLNLGVVQVNQNRLSEAAETFEELLKIDPNSIAAMRNLAYTYDQLGQTDKANAWAAAAARLEQRQAGQHH